MLNDRALKRLVLIASIVFVLAVEAGTAQGAPAPKRLGETATAVTASVNCACTAIQFGDLGTSNNSYVFPYAGVITRSSFYVGEPIGVDDWVQMRSFAHKPGPYRLTASPIGANGRAVSAQTAVFAVAP